MDRNSKVLIGVTMAFTVLALGTAFAAANAVRSAGLVSSAPAAYAFPAAELRTAKEPPKFTLENQDGEAITLEALRGKVVLLTAVFASCHEACPTIITTAKTALNKLNEAQRRDVAMVAITLDPEGDTRERRAATAKAHGLQAPLFHYVNGTDPASVLKLVEDLGWARAVAGDTGVIGHSNLFLLVDRTGKIAYTLSADGDPAWLDSALQTLLAE